MTHDNSTLFLRYLHRVAPQREYLQADIPSISLHVRPISQLPLWTRSLNSASFPASPVISSRNNEYLRQFEWRAKLPGRHETLVAPVLHLLLLLLYLSRSLSLSLSLSLALVFHSISPPLLYCSSMMISIQSSHRKNKEEERSS